MPLPELPTSGAPLGSAKAEMAKRLETRRQAREKAPATPIVKAEPSQRQEQQPPPPALKPPPLQKIDPSPDHLAVSQNSMDNEASSPLHDVYFNSEEDMLPRSKHDDLHERLRMGEKSKAATWEADLSTRGDTAQGSVKADDGSLAGSEPSIFETLTRQGTTTKPLLRIDVPAVSAQPTSLKRQGPQSAPLLPKAHPVLTPGPKSAPPKLMYLTNPWDNDVVVLDEEEEKAAATEFYAKHANLSMPGPANEDSSSEEDLSYLTNKSEEPGFAMANGWDRDDDLGLGDESVEQKVETKTVGIHASAAEKPLSGYQSSCLELRFLTETTPHKFTATTNTCAPTRPCS